MLIYADTMPGHTGSFQIQFLGFCPLSIDQKISLISLATDSSSRSGFVGILFQNKYRSSEKYANFIHRLGATDYGCRDKT